MSKINEEHFLFQTKFLHAIAFVEILLDLNLVFGMMLTYRILKGKYLSWQGSPFLYRFVTAAKLFLGNLVILGELRTIYQKMIQCRAGIRTSDYTS